MKRAHWLNSCTKSLSCDPFAQAVHGIRHDIRDESNTVHGQIKAEEA